MKKTLAIYGIIYAMLAALFYASGYFRDEYPQILIPAYTEALLWSLVIMVPIAVCFLLFNVCKRVHKGIFVAIVSAFICLMVSSGCLVYEAFSK